MNTIRFVTFGCKVNSYETQAIREHALRNGFIEVDDMSAEWHIINTCTVTGSADSKSLKAVRSVLRNNPKAIVVALGCLAEKDAQSLVDAGARYVIPQSRKAEVLRLLDDVSVPRNIWDFNISDFDQYRAFVKVQDGCDNSCSFCKVTIVRGESRSRPMEDVCNECVRLIDKGCSEIVLCGTNLARWQQGKLRFFRLLETLLRIKELGRIRLSSVEAEEVDDELVSLMAAEPRICPHLHIPFQSGDDEILSRMNKRTGRKGYSTLIERIRRMIPDCAISADIMVGFPGEKEQHFRNTLALLKEADIMRVHVFPFSPRPGTAAVKLGPPETDSAARVNITYQESARIAYDWRKRFEGRFARVVFDEQTPDGMVQGYTEHYLRVTAESGQPGRQLVPVLITRVTPERTLVEVRGVI
jgi:threonylcarbamoyladenosine tRNA methylthiotransferase MtaB